MSDERELLIYWLRILYSSKEGNTIERMEEQQQNIADMKRIIELNPVLSSDERNILSLVFKNYLSSRRGPVRDFQQYLRRSDIEIPDSRRAAIARFIGQLQTEILEVARDLIELIDSSLLPVCSEPEQRVFYHKMKADYFRYVCENEDDPDRVMYCEKARACYQEAIDIAQAELNPTSAQVLGLILNFTVFLYETMQCHSEAIELATRTYNETIDLIDAEDNLGYNETTVILNLLRDNKERWVHAREHAVL